MKVIQYSVGRSGSTLVTQIVNALDGVEVRATHIYRRNLLNRKMIIPFRDFRDVLVSKWRANEEVPSEDLFAGRKMTRADLDKWLPVVADSVRVLNRTVKSNPHALLLQYEKFVDDYDYIFDRVEVYLGKTYTPELKAELKERFSLAANKRRSEQLESFTQWDEQGIHGKHVFTGEIGTWKKVIGQENHALVNHFLGADLSRWGYLID